LKERLDEHLNQRLVSCVSWLFCPSPDENLFTETTGIILLQLK
jgi:hypothetical protein